MQDTPNGLPDNFQPNNLDFGDRLNPFSDLGGKRRTSFLENANPFTERTKKRFILCTRASLGLLCFGLVCFSISKIANYTPTNPPAQIQPVQVEQSPHITHALQIPQK